MAAGSGAFVPARCLVTVTASFLSQGGPAASAGAVRGGQEGQACPRLARCPRFAAAPRVGPRPVLLAPYLGRMGLPAVSQAFGKPQGREGWRGMGEALCSAALPGTSPGCHASVGFPLW